MEKKVAFTSFALVKEKLLISVLVQSSTVNKVFTVTITNISALTQSWRCVSKYIYSVVHGCYAITKNAGLLFKFSQAQLKNLLNIL